MDKQHSDHIEDRIRQAAEGITTPVTEEAWQKMELLLDKQDKKKRRGIFWWWYLLFFGLATGSGLWYYTGKQNQDPVKQQQSVIRPESETSLNQKSSTKPAPRENTSLPTAPAGSGQSSSAKTDVPGTVESGAKTKISVTQSPVRPTKQSTLRRNTAGTGGGQYRWASGHSKKTKTLTDKSARQLRANQDNTQNPEAQTASDQATGKNTVATTPPHAVESQNPGLKTQGSDSTLAKVGEPRKKELPASDSLVTKNDNRKPPKTSVKFNKPGFYLTASFAKDATSIDKISFKTYKPVYGAGIGYRFSNRVSVQTGFYVGGKIYRAGPGDYKLRQGTNVRQIIYIDADCYIYELPLLVRYDVLAKRKYNVYATTGLSTYFFKKENYDFHYLNLTGAYRRMPYNYKNNTDYFSVADFSVGFEYKILNRLYIQAEPYLKIPLSGLGEGKVKLTSAGLLAGMRYQPFYRKTKK